MSSKFSTGSVRLIPPSWCKKGMFTGIIPTINDRPRTMNALASWLILDSAGLIALEETVHLSRNTPDNGWDGEVRSDDFQTKVQVLDRLDPTAYTLTTTLEELGIPVATSMWIHFQELGDEVWDTGVLTNVITPGIREYELRILA